MKILQLSNKPPWPLKDGGAIAILNLTKGFFISGHQVTLIAMNTLKHHIKKEDIPDTIKRIADFRFPEVPAEITFFGTALNFLFSRKPFTAVRFISRTFESELISTLKETSFDLIQLEGLYLCPYIPVIRTYSSAVIAYRAHNIESEIWDRTAAISSGIKKWYFSNLTCRIRKFEEKWLNRYDVLVPITERDGRLLNTMGNVKPVHVAPAGVDPDSFNIGQANMEFPSLFHIGSLEWSPNQEGLIWFLKNCWGKIRSKYPELRFYIAGRNAPKWLSDKLNQPGVVFLGEIGDAFAFMKSKAVMIVPLLSGSGMRVKIVEGMATGKTIVSTSIGAEGLQVENSLNILIADTPGDFIRSIESLIGDKILFDRIGEEASVFVRNNFNYVTIARELTAFYQTNLK
jgi:polysaccharide biosynthesis protein PslH